jgi:hypothetical protein
LHFQVCEKIRGSAGRKRHDLVKQQLAQIAREHQVPVTVEERPMWFAAQRTANASRLIQWPTRNSTTVESKCNGSNSHSQSQGAFSSPRRNQSSTALKESGYDSDCEYTGQQRPDLCFQVQTTRYLDLLSDVSITHPGCRDITDLHAAKLREQQKSAKYAHFERSGQTAFTPFVLESSGAWGSKAEKLLSKLMQQIPFAEGEGFGTKADYMRDARTRIAVALHKGNALMARQCVYSMSNERDVYAAPLNHHRYMPAASRSSRRVFHRF